MQSYVIIRQQETEENARAAAQQAEEEALIIAEMREAWEAAWHCIADREAHAEALYGEMYAEWQEQSGDYATPFTVWLDEYTPWDHD